MLLISRGTKKVGLCEIQNNLTLTKKKNCQAIRKF